MIDLVLLIFLGCPTSLDIAYEIDAFKIYGHSDCFQMSFEIDNVSRSYYVVKP